MQIVSMGGVPDHKRQEREELAAMMAAFEGGVTRVPGVKAPLQMTVAQPEPRADPHSAPLCGERTIVTELRAIRHEARTLSAKLARLSQAAFE